MSWKDNPRPLGISVLRYKERTIQVNFHKSLNVPLKNVPKSKRSAWNFKRNKHLLNKVDIEWIGGSCKSKGQPLSGVIDLERRRTIVIGVVIEIDDGIRRGEIHVWAGVD